MNLAHIERVFTKARHQKSSHRNTVWNTTRKKSHLNCPEKHSNSSTWLTYNYTLKF